MSLFFFYLREWRCFFPLPLVTCQSFLEALLSERRKGPAVLPGKKEKKIAVFTLKLHFPEHDH